MRNYSLEIYRQLLTSVKRGRAVVGLSKAKPIFLISLIDYVPFLNENAIEFDCGSFKAFYKSNNDFFSPENKSGYEVPFYHLHTEPFYHLLWKCDDVVEQIQHTPSAKLLRENLLYAKLDDELWELLQDAANREYLKQAIIDQYLKD